MKKLLRGFRFLFLFEECQYRQWSEQGPLKAFEKHHRLQFQKHSDFEEYQMTGHKSESGIL